MIKPSELARAADRDVLAKYVAELPRAPHAHGPIEIIRKDDYNGHQIVIKTTYDISVDGQPLGGHMGLANDGRIMSHALPNFVFGSAVEMVRRLIDFFPGDFLHQHQPSKDHEHPHGGPQGGADHDAGGHHASGHHGGDHHGGGH
jgi:hypothetical protein